MTTFDNTDKVNEAMALIDKLGDKPVPRMQWIDLLQQIRSECSIRLEAAYADQRNEDKREQEPEPPEDFDPAD